MTLHVTAEDDFRAFAFDMRSFFLMNPDEAPDHLLPLPEPFEILGQSGRQIRSSCT